MISDRCGTPVQARGAHRCGLLPLGHRGLALRTERPNSRKSQSFEFAVLITLLLLRNAAALRADTVLSPGDPTLDYSGPLQAALDAGGKVTLPSGTYTITRPLTIHPNTAIWSPSGAIVQFHGPPGGSIDITSIFLVGGAGTYPDVPAMKAYYDIYPPVIGLRSALNGAQTLECSAPGCFAAVRPGTWIVIAEGSAPKWNYYREYLQVQSISGDTVTLSKPLDFALGTTGAPFGFYRISPTENVSISGLTIRGDARTAYSLLFAGCFGCSVSNNTFDNPDKPDISIMSNGTASRFEHNVVTRGIFNGFEFGTDSQVVDNDFLFVDRGSAEFAEGAARIHISGNRYINPTNTNGILGFGAARNITISDNRFVCSGTCPQAIYHSSGKHFVITGNSFLNQSSAPIGLAHTTTPPRSYECSDITISGNLITLAEKSLSPAIYVGPCSSVAIFDNTIVTAAGIPAIRIDSGSTPPKGAGYSIWNNRDHLDAPTPSRRHR